MQQERSHNYIILACYPASLGRKGGEVREGGAGGRGGREARDGGEGGREGPEQISGSLPPALPHCLLYFIKLYNVLNDNVQSIR